jgi:hypothetical protein
MAIFSYTTGTTGGFYITPFSVSSAGDLNGLANGNTTTLAGGTAYTQASFSSGIWGYVLIKFGATAFTATAGGFISGWWLSSHDGGTTYETLNVTSSSTISSLPRPPDWVIPLDAANLSSAVKWSTLARLPNAQSKIVVQNLAGVTLSAATNTVFVAPIAIQAV